MSEHETAELAADASAQAERILIVDDDPSMRTALMESIRRLGYDVQGAIDVQLRFLTGVGRAPVGRGQADLAFRIFKI